MKREESIFKSEPFRKAIDSLPTAIYTTDPDGKLTYFNSAAVELSGCEPEVGSDHWYLSWKLFYPDGSPMSHDECPMAVALKEGRSIKGAEGIIERPDGKRFWFEAYPSPLRYEDGFIFGGINMLLNITERKKVQHELKAMNETLEEQVEERTQSLLSYQKQLRSLASQLSLSEENQRQQLASELHDNLAQLLAVSKMKVDLLEKEQFSNQAASDIDELKELIDNALSYTRELMSELNPPPSIGEDILAAVEWIAEKMEKKGLEVTIEDDGRSKPLGEEVRGTVLQCVRELLFNVVKHSAEKRATIRLRRKKNLLKIAVVDEGGGFDVENTEFTPAKDGGYGLFNIQERIDLLGGRMEIVSEVGMGTKVTLYIPIKKETEVERTLELFGETGQAEKPRAKQSIHQKRIGVLLVDDHQMMREGLRKFIEAQDDMEVLAEGSSGEEAIQLSRKHSPDVILMDVSMPGMDGIKATRKITSEMPNIHVIGLSLHDEERIVKDMRNAGASAYLTKTEALESLVQMIRAEASVRQKSNI